MEVDQDALKLAIEKCARHRAGPGWKAQLQEWQDRGAIENWALRMIRIEYRNLTAPPPEDAIPLPEPPQDRWTAFKPFGRPRKR